MSDTLRFNVIKQMTGAEVEKREWSLLLNSARRLVIQTYINPREL